MKHNCRCCYAGSERQSVKGEHVYGGGEGHHFWECAECKMIYLYPPLSEEEEKRFYTKEFEKYMDERSGKDKDWSGPAEHCKTNQPEVERRMKYLDSYLGGVNRALELGCSSGFMLDALKARGIDVCGVDPSEGFIDYVASKGIDVYKSVEELKIARDGGYDLILHYYVLEHVGDPVGFVKQYMSMLNPKGKMIFEVPCASDPLIELYGVPSFDRFYWSIAHHWYFNKESLSRVLQETGYAFQLLPEQRYDVSNHMTWMLDGKPGGLGRYSGIFGKEFDDLYKERLKKSWLCDTIIAVIQK